MFKKRDTINLKEKCEDKYISCFPISLIDFIRKIELLFALSMYDSAHPVQDKINNKSLTINFHSIVSHKMLFVYVRAYVHTYILHTYVCVSGGKKLSFFGKSGVLCFFVTPVLRFVLLPNYQRVQILISFPIMYSLTIFGKKNFTDRD